MGFLGGIVDKNPLANAGDMGLISGLRKSHCLGATKSMRPTMEPKLQSPRAETAEAYVPGANALQQEKPEQ